MSVPTPPENLVKQPNRGHTTFHISEIYRPGAADPTKAIQVPNVHDLIVDYSSGFLRCVAVDYTTGLSELLPWQPVLISNSVANQDLLLGSAPNRASEAYRAYLDTSITPFSLSLDTRLHLYGSGNRHIKIFRGSDISELTGEVISRFYDQSGNFLGENIPLEKVSMEDINNISIQTPVVAYCVQTLDDGEQVTVVVYDDAGNVRSATSVTVVNTSFVRTVDSSLEYIVNIGLESPFLSDTDPTTIEIPLNMPVANIPMMGVLTYNSGRVNKIPVDGSKFSVLGLENFIATRAGQTAPVGLSYKLSAGEHSYGMNVSVNGHITKEYHVRTASPDSAYRVKIYAFPEWVDLINGYKLKFYLTSLTRGYTWDITSKVTQGQGARAFNPTQYAILQRCAFMVNLNNVDGNYNAYHHVETFDILLSGPPNDELTTPWTVGFEPNQDPAYGEDASALLTYMGVGEWHVELAGQSTTQAEWLEKIYYRTLPVFDDNSELAAPVPTHFYMTIGAHRQLFNISEWNAVIPFAAGGVTGKNVYLEFIRRVSADDLQLSAAALPIRRNGVG